MKTKTPICNFVNKYAESGSLRFHMPGHKGKSILGYEKFDITEIAGADSLYDASGIIAESERNAAELFDSAKTLYSTEGSSQCIRAMLYLALQHKQADQKPIIVATRNAHKVFALTVALLGIKVVWLENESETNTLCGCKTTAQGLEKVLSALPCPPIAVYVTSPDYLGNMADIRGLAAVTHKYNSLLLVDNAHGAYLKFLNISKHPIDLGADMCCDSAHKTLPVLTGGAYLHISKHAPTAFTSNAKNAMSMFGSTSPSYLILQSLDKTNDLLFDGYGEKIKAAVSRIAYFKKKLSQTNWKFANVDEPLKITIDAKENGYTGAKLAKLLSAYKIVPEYVDPDYIVLMVSAETDFNDFDALQKALTAIPVKKRIEKPNFIVPHKAVMTMKKALSCDTEYVDVNESLKRIIAEPTVSCPPAVPVLFGGEVVSEQAVETFNYYGIKKVKVVKETTENK